MPELCAIIGFKQTKVPHFGNSVTKIWITQEYYKPFLMCVHCCQIPKPLFNSCERLLLGTLILDIRSSRISDLSFGPLSDLINGITENGLRHTSGPVHAQHSIRYIGTINNSQLIQKDTQSSKLIMMCSFNNILNLILLRTQ